MTYRELLEFCEKNPNPFSLNRSTHKKYGIVKITREEIEEIQNTRVYGLKK